MPIIGLIVSSGIVIALTFLIPLLFLIPGLGAAPLFTALILTGFLSLSGTEETRREHGWRTPASIDILLSGGLLFFSLAAGFLSRKLFRGPAVEILNSNFIWMLPISAFVEETFFHSWLLVAWLPSEEDSHASGRVKALSLSAALFGIIHLWQGWFAIFYSAAIGIVYSLVFLRWRRILPLVLAHFFYNLIVIAVYS